MENVKANMKSRVQCEKQTLVRVQSRKNVKLVPGHVTLDRSLKFAKSRFTHKIIIIILNRFFLVENVKQT